MSNGEEKLSVKFNRVWRTQRELATTSDSTENAQKLILKSLEEINQILEIVEHLSLFSSNESIDEVSTTDLRYLLVNPLKSWFLTRIRALGADRLTNLEQAEYCNGKFVQLLDHYQLKMHTATLEGTDRAGKIERFKKSKELDEKINFLLSSASSSSSSSSSSTTVGSSSDRDDDEELFEQLDDEVIRDLFLSVIQRWQLSVYEESKQNVNEIEILTQMLERKDGELPPVPAQPAGAAAPFRPFIIARDVAQAHVLGAGYPSLPTLTVDQWYEQRFAAPSANGHGHAHGQPPQQPGISQAAQPDPEREAAQRELLAEREDPDLLRQQRGWDDWKDDHKRGEGNRNNRS